MSVNVANAPVSWGVDYPDAPENPAWQTVMSGIAEAGYRFTELGPLGYYPEDPAVFGEALRSRGLTLVGGHIFEPLHDGAERERILGVADRVCRMIAPNGGRRLVVIDHISVPRNGTAGRPEAAERLDPARWRAMMGLVADVARMARDEHGVTAVLHPHSACFIEFEDEIERAMDELDPDLVKLCVDTGHSVYARVDPAALLRRHGARVQHLHFKDVNPAVHAEVVAEGVDFDAAVGRGVFCPLGRGMVDFEEFRRALDETGYRAAGTVEQDVDPTKAPDAVGDARRSLDYLRGAGIAA